MEKGDQVTFTSHKGCIAIQIGWATCNRYLIKATLPNGLSYAAYTYAGELPCCAFSFNSHDLAFTLNSVPTVDSEIAAGGIGQNFISRDLIEATSIEDAITRIRSSQVPVGHSYNLMDINLRKIVNVETASSQRLSVHQVGSIVNAKVAKVVV